MTKFPDKISAIERKTDDTFVASLANMPALRIEPQQGWDEATSDTHTVTINFPRYYPSLPCEIFLHRPVFHPNVDPMNGFVCLWSRHRVANTIADALAKLAAVLSWRLYNADAPHLMQPDALSWYANSEGARSRLPLTSGPWLCVKHGFESQPSYRRRLS